MKFPGKLLTSGMLLFVLLGCTEETSNWPEYPALFEFSGLAPTPTKFYLQNDVGLIEQPPSNFQITWADQMHHDIYRDTFIPELLSRTAFEFLSDQQVRVHFSAEGQDLSLVAAYTREGNQIIIDSEDGSQQILLEATEPFVVLEHCYRTFGRFSVWPTSGEAGYYPFRTDPCDTFDEIQILRDLVENGQTQVGDSVLLMTYPAVYIRTQ